MIVPLPKVIQIHIDAPCNHIPPHRHNPYTEPCPPPILSFTFSYSLLRLLSFIQCCSMLIPSASHSTAGRITRREGRSCRGKEIYYLFVFLVEFDLETTSGSLSSRYPKKSRQQILALRFSPLQSYSSRQLRRRYLFCRCQWNKWNLKLTSTNPSSLTFFSKAVKTGDSKCLSTAS